MAMHQLITKDGFRLRGAEMSRIDGFSDVVFGFALTLIVVSLEVPKTYAEMHEIMLGFVPFFICFVFLFMVWWSHFRFFRRYGLHDAGTVMINAGLLFTVLFYAYPLKFLFTLVSGEIMHREGADAVFTSAHQVRELMTFYGIGFAAIYFFLTALHWNAWRQRDELELSPVERTLTLSYLWDHFGVGCVGIVCAVLAHVLPANRAGDAGFAFFLIGLWKTIHGTISGKKLRKSRVASGLEL